MVMLKENDRFGSFRKSVIKLRSVQHRVSNIFNKRSRQCPAIHRSDILTENRGS